MSNTTLSGFEAPKSLKPSLFERVRSLFVRAKPPVPLHGRAWDSHSRLRLQAAPILNIQELDPSVKGARYSYQGYLIEFLDHPGLFQVWNRYGRERMVFLRDPNISTEEALRSICEVCDAWSEEPSYCPSEDFFA